MSRRALLGRAARAARGRSPGTSSSRARIFSPRLIWPDLLDPVGARVVGAHQLDVVDDQRQPARRPRSLACRRRALARRSSRLRSEESSIHSGASSSSLQALTTFGQSRSETLPLRSLSLGIRARRGDEAVGQLGLRHLEREEGDRPPLLDRDVLGDVADQRRLAHRRPGGEDDQVAGLKAAGDQSSRSRKPDGVPVSSASAVREVLEAVDLVARGCRRGPRKSSACSSWATLNSSVSALLDELARLAARARATDCWISCEASSSRRRSEFCLTIRA